MTQERYPPEGTAAVPPPPPDPHVSWPPPPPPPHRFSTRGRLGAAAALVALAAAGGTAGFVITATGPSGVTPAASTTGVTGGTGGTTATPSPGVRSPGHHLGAGIGLPGLRLDLLQEAASAIGVSEQTLATDLRSGQSVAQVATANGKTAQDVINALVGDATTAIDAAQQKGTITSAQATEMKSHLTQMVTGFVDATRPAGLPGRGGAGAGVAIQAAAKAIGISAPTLRSDIAAGQTVAAVAGAHGVSTGSVESAVVTAVDAQIGQLESSGRISSSQAGALTSQVPQRVDAWVTETFPGWPFGPFGVGAGPDHGFPGSPASAPAPGSASTS